MAATFYKSPMPILMILLLTAACLPVPWPRPLDSLDARSMLAIAGAYVLGGVLLSIWGCYRVLRTIPKDRGAAASLYFRLRRRFALVQLWESVALVLGGWGWAVREFASDAEGRLAPFAELLVPGPYLLILLMNWVVWFFGERALHATGTSTRPFWSLPAYVLHQARQFVLLLFLPVLMISTQQTISRHFPELANSTPYQVASFCWAFALLLLLPLFVKPLLGLKRLPNGFVREQLTATAKRMRFRYSDWLLWPTRGLIANAMIIGVLPQARFVIFTDRLLEAFDPPELNAVLGHEIGHARHGHIPYYFGFLLLSSVVGGALLNYLESLRILSGDFEDFGLLVGMFGLGVYIFVVFGFLSRVCERQADIVGAKAGSCANPNCEGHTPETELVEGGQSLCPTGVRAMARALELVMHLSGLDRPQRGSIRQWLFAWWKSWQHGPPSHRIDFLLSLLEQPRRAARHDRFAFRVRVGLIVILLMTLIGTATLIGWDEFITQL